MRSDAELIHKSSNNSGTLYQIENYVGLRIKSIKKGILESANLEHVFLIKKLVTDSHWWPGALDLDYNKL